MILIDSWLHPQPIHQFHHHTAVFYPKVGHPALGYGCVIIPIYNKYIAHGGKSPLQAGIYFNIVHLCIVLLILR